MEDTVTGFIKGDINEALMCNIIRSNRWKDFHKELQKQIKGINKKHYFYLCTFTLSVNVCPSVRKVNEIEEYIIRQFRRVPLKIVQAYYAKEYTKKNIPHWHVAVETTKFLSKNSFNYYQKIYGFVDISRSRINSIEESLNYINKDNVSIKI